MKTAYVKNGERKSIRRKEGAKNIDARRNDFPVKPSKNVTLALPVEPFDM
jgi:hypothetical protein